MVRPVDVFTIIAMTIVITVDILCRTKTSITNHVIQLYTSAKVMTPRTSIFLLNDDVSSIK